MAGKCHLITGHKGEAHISSADVGECNIGTLGDGLVTVSKFPQGTMVNSNTLSLDGATYLTQGRFIITKQDTIPIESGPTSGYRVDSILLRYTNIDGIESIEYAVEKGEQTSTLGSRPISPYENLRMNDGSPIVDFCIGEVSHKQLSPEFNRDEDTTSLRRPDFILAEGLYLTSGTTAEGYAKGKWRKWNSGVAEFFGSVECGTKTGGLYQYHTWIELPILMVGVTNTQSINTTFEFCGNGADKNKLILANFYDGKINFHLDSISGTFGEYAKFWFYATYSWTG